MMRRVALGVALACLVEARTAGASGLGEGWRLFEAGDLARAEAAFRAALTTPGERAPALEGLTWTAARRGDAAAAAAHADARAALAPGEVAWRKKWLAVIGRLPARRAEALGWYTRLLARHDDVELRRQHAELLVGMKRWEEAFASYREGLRAVPHDRGLSLGFARALAWSGRGSEAGARLAALLERAPRDREALLLRAQIARWSGELSLARASLARGLADAPRDAALLAELAQLELRAGSRSAAREALRAAAEVSPAHPEVRMAAIALERELAPRLSLRSIVSDESTGFRRVGGGLLGELYPLPDLRLRLEGLHARIDDGRDALQRTTGGTELRQRLPGGLRLDASYRAHVAAGAPSIHEAGGELAGRWFGGSIELRASGRQRGFIDVPVGYEDVALFGGMGSGGATLASVRHGLQVRETRTGLSAAPHSAMYAYADLAVGWVSDGNRLTSLAAGLGLDLFRLDGLSGHELRLKYDFFFMAARLQTDDYFSPASFQVHSTGLEWRWRLAAGAVLGVEAAVPLAADAPPGLHGGAFFAAPVGRVISIEGRLRYLDNTRYRLTVGALELRAVF